MTGAILGHSNARSTSIYAHVQHDPAKRAAGRAVGPIAAALLELKDRAAVAERTAALAATQSRANPELMLATTRGRMLELLAKKLRPSQRNIADVAFTVGIMSLMDTLFGIPMSEILAQIKA